jgi:hypothetical protein
MFLVVFLALTFTLLMTVNINLKKRVLDNKWLIKKIKSKRRF